MDLTPMQHQELTELVDQSADVFASSPCLIDLVHHDIKTPLGVVVRHRPYCIPEACHHAIEEVSQMLHNGIIEESPCPRSSPIIVVPKHDGSIWLFNDFRKLNEVSNFDSYPPEWMTWWRGWGEPGSSPS